MENIKLIAMDMDGTLLDDTHQIPHQNLTALRKAQAMGVQIAICSGRTAGDVSFYAADAGLEDCHILALNGACCLTHPHGEPYLLRTVLPETASHTVDVLLSHKVTFASFQQNRIIVVHGDNAVDKRNWGTHVARANRNAYLYGREALEAHIGEGVCKFVYIDQDHAPRIERVREALLPIGGLAVTRSWTNNLELMPEGVNKGTALRSLAEALDIPRTQVMAIGDFDNDLDMIAYAGLGVAMRNGSERVRNAANHITLSNTEFGVAEAIRRFVLEVAV